MAGIFLELGLPTADTVVYNYRVFSLLVIVCCHAVSQVVKCFTDIAVFTFLWDFSQTLVLEKLATARRVFVLNKRPCAWAYCCQHPATTVHVAKCGHLTDTVAYIISYHIINI